MTQPALATQSSVDQTGTAVPKSGHSSEKRRGVRFPRDAGQEFPTGRLPSPIAGALLQLKSLERQFHRQASSLSASVEGEHRESSVNRAQPVDAERRIYPRREARGAISLLRSSTAEIASHKSGTRTSALDRVHGELIDLSRNGLAIVLHQPLVEGERIEIRLPLADRCHQSDRTAIVVRSIELAAGLWKVVAQFHEPLTFDDAYQLFDHALTNITGPGCLANE